MAGYQEEHDRRMIGYLLGTLPEVERTRLEDDYFADDTLFEELAAVEAELVDAYVRGTLASSERAQFEARYLASSEQRARIAFARQLIEKPHKGLTRGTDCVCPPLDRESRQDPLGKTVETQVGWWHRARPALGWLPWRPWLVPALAGAGLTVVAGAGWLAMQPASLPVATEATRAQSPAPAPAQRTSPTTEAVHTVPATPPPATTPERQPRPGRGTAAIDAIALVLVPGMTRSSGQGSPVLAIASGTSSVRIQADHEGESFPSYRAVLRTPEGEEVWRQSGLTPVQPGVKSVVIVVPAAILRSGADYVLSLSGTPPRGPVEDVADYTFRVASR
jgi:hypothetical protein